jgi:hypothetical protein
MPQRGLEGSRHFPGVEPELEVRMHEADDGCHAKPADDRVVRQESQDLDPVARKPDLLLSLPQRGRRGVGIARLEAPAGKGDLPGVVREAVGPQRQQHRELVATIDDRHEDCSVGHDLRHERMQLARIGAGVMADAE